MALYHYFPGRDSLLESALEHAFSALNTADGEEDPAALLRQYVTQAANTKR